MIKGVIWEPAECVVVEDLREMPKILKNVS